MEASSVSVSESRNEEQKRKSSKAVVPEGKAFSETETISAESTTPNGSVEGQQTTSTAMLASSSDHAAQEFVLVRWMHPKMSVPLLVLSGDAEKPGVEARGALDGQLTLNGSSLQIAGQAVTSSTASFISLEQCCPQQPRLGKPCSTPGKKVDTDDQSASKIATVKSGGKYPRGTKEKHPAEKLFICEVEGCGRSFSSMGYLRYHQAVHEGQKALKCTYEGCDRKFSWPAHLKYHLLTHTNDRRFKCSVADCGKSFYTPQRLAVHLRTHTGEKPFVCGEPGCDKSFTTAGNLKNHSRIHTGERPYACTYQNCGRQFAEYSSLKKHKLTHTGEKPYCCDICGRTFSQVASQKVHVRGHLKIRSNKKDKQEKAEETSKQNVVVLRQEDILQYQDFQGSESVVFSQAVGDHVVTVTTQPAEGESDQLGLQPPEILGVEEVLTSEECIQGDALCGSNTMGANVVVLSQPQEIVSMSPGFTSGDRTTQEEAVYDGDLLHSDLDHEEIASNINEPDLSEDQAISHHSRVRSTDREVGMDPMMETDDDDESETEVWVEND